MTAVDILLPFGLWCVWWLCCVNWRHCWPILAAGGWVVICGLGLLATILWTAIDPVACKCFPHLTLSAFLSHFVGVVLLVVVALLCGWLQGRCSWGPEEVIIDPYLLPSNETSHRHARTERIDHIRG